MDNLGPAGNAPVIDLVLTAKMLFPVLAVMGLVSVMEGLFTLARACIPLVPSTAAAVIGSALSQAIREQRAPHVVLAEAATRLEWPFTGRIRRASDELAGNGSCDIAATLVRHRLLPRTVLQSGMSAERLGAAALADWAHQLGGRIDVTRRLMAPFAPLCAIGVLLTLQLAFITAVIVPKYAQIFRELETDLVGPLAWLQHAPPWYLQFLAVGGAIVAFWSALTMWRWRVAQRLLTARVVLSGVAAGASERELAESLGLAPAVAEGGFPALASALGWPGAAQPVELVEALTAAEERDRRLVTWLVTGVQLVLPLLFAIPVWLMATGVFSALIRVMTSISQDGN